MTTRTAKRVFRLLMVEDDDERIQRVRSWLPRGIPLASAVSAGQAIGLLRRDRGHVYGGVMLDHDLQKQAKTQADLSLSGTQVVGAVIECLSVDVPLMVHSVNAAHAPAMVVRLEGAGFSVTRAPFSELKREDFLSWLQECQETWEDA